MLALRVAHAAGEDAPPPGDAPPSTVAPGPEAEPHPAATPAPDPAPDPAAALRHAITLYQSGESGDARTELQLLLAQGPTLPAAVRLEALAWLGDILFGEQGIEAARNPFTALLGEDPDFTLDPFAHSPEACAAFEQVKAELRLRAAVVAPPPRPADRPPFPTAILVPGGYYYFHEGKAGIGVLVGGIQLGGLATSVALGVDLLEKRRIDTNDEAAIRRYKQEWVTNLAIGGVGWVAYLTPLAVESARWRRSGTVSVRVGPGSVGIAATF